MCRGQHLPKCVYALKILHSEEFLKETRYVHRDVHLFILGENCNQPNLYWERSRNNLHVQWDIHVDNVIVKYLRKMFMILNFWQKRMMSSVN